MYAMVVGVALINLFVMLSGFDVNQCSKQLVWLESS